MPQHGQPYRIPGGDIAYQGKHHWDTQKKLMRQNLMEGGVTAEEADKLVAKIVVLTRNSGNIPRGHPDENIPGEAPEDDIIQAQQGYGGPPMPSLPNVEEEEDLRAGVGMGGEMLGDEPPASRSMASQFFGPPSSPRIEEPSLMSSVFDNADAVDSILGMGELDRQMATAEGLRDKEGPQGRGGIGTRNIYVAANPLSHIASGVSKYRAKKDIKRLAIEQKDARKALISILRNKDEDEVKEAPMMNLPSTGGMI